MPIPSPFHSRTSPLTESHEWRNWSGYLAASLYEINHEREYFAIRNSAALIDVSPLYKYEFRGPDAQRALNRIMTRDLTRCAIGQVLYTPWCDDRGKVIDDGTVARLAPDYFRVTAAEPNLAWFQDCSDRMDVSIADVSEDLAALAVQGPASRAVLQQLVEGLNLVELKYYHVTEAQIGRLPVSISRTGYTGDLGYELWISADHAAELWDKVFEAGRPFGVQPAGILALDIARIEAGLVMLQVDYISARKALIPEQNSSPYEIGLGWAVNLEKASFIGRKALAEEAKRGPRWKLVGLEVDWSALEAVYEQYHLAPTLAGRASRAAIPVYKSSRQVGQVPSHTFSPILKKYIALGTLESAIATPGQEVQMEFTVEYVHHPVAAKIGKLPFYNPVRKRD
jgi:aminomethyltransferase